MTNEPEQPAGASEPAQEPTQQFTQPYPTASGSGGYPGPSGPPPSANPWLFGEQTMAAPVDPPRERRRGRAGLIGGLAALALIVGGGAGYGGAALWNNTHDDTSTSGIFSGSGSSGTSAKTTAPSGSVQAVAQSVLPSVVKIEVAGSQESGSGSGIILTSDGTILTNNHVVEVAGDNGKIRVDFNDGSSADAKIVGTDPLTDTAIIKAQGVSNLKPATIGNSNDLAVGQSVVAIGSPFGLDSTVTSGIVSALNRPVNVGSDSSSNATVYPAIQTDAAINPGNSGGPLVDMSGKVVGINASIRSASDSSTGEAGSIGLGFAIPMDEVKPVIEQMIKGETPTHARLGITVQNVGASQQDQQQQPDQGNPFDPFGQQPQQQQQPDSSTPFASNGAEVRQVGSGSTAQKAGIKAGDVITKVDDKIIVDSDSLVATVRSYRPGDKVSVTYTRDGKSHTVNVTLDSDEGSTKS
jgi:putative serine protease PepD